MDKIQLMSLILGIIGTTGTIVTAITAFVRSRFHINVELLALLKTPKGIQAYFVFTNKSFTSVAITDVRIIVNNKSFSCIRVPTVAIEKISGKGTDHETVEKIDSLAFPINLPSLAGSSGYLLFPMPPQIQESFSNAVTVELSTNRRRKYRIAHMTCPDSLESLFQ